uniref:Uncharacterized protein n=1 Tax=Caenorhabditis japonica TaxID=281687 RepID=A0A8R1EWA2_CAEJA
VLNQMKKNYVVEQASNQQIQTKSTISGKEDIYLNGFCKSDDVLVPDIFR